VSYDVSLTINTGVEDTEAEEIRNVTYNNARIFNKALGCSLRELNGKTAGDMIELIYRAIRDIEKNKVFYKPLEPGNGWGGVDDALDFLEKLHKGCRKHPLTKICVS
jgi:hypothetical protein